MLRATPSLTSPTIMYRHPVVKLGKSPIVVRENRESSSRSAPQQPHSFNRSGVSHSAFNLIQYRVGKAYSLAQRSHALQPRCGDVPGGIKCARIWIEMILLA